MIVELPDEEKNRAYAYYSVSSLSGANCAVVFGGFLLQWMSYTALFAVTAVLSVLLFLVAALFIAYRIPSGKAKIRHFLTVFPFTKSFYDKIAAGRFARGMYLSYQSGMDTYHSLDMIKEIVENEEMAKKIERCKAQMQGQADLPEALASAEIFSNLYSRMVSVGFRSGSMDVVMLQIASHYEEETDRQLSRIVSIIEPTLVIILSLIVGVILLSVLLPLMGIMASIG